VKEHWTSRLSKGSVLITGGAGFIGSHLIDKMSAIFLNGVDLHVIDNLSNCDITNISGPLRHKYFHFTQGSFDRPDVLAPHLQDTRTVFHLAAYPEVRTGFEHPDIPFEQNVRNTYILLENIRKSQVEEIYFTSSSTVYGEANQLPTREDYGPLLPISPYGASKLACEALISSYCHTYGLKAQIFRMANVVGSRNRHGILPDLIGKLHGPNTSLELLGDGLQTKSYVHISDCIDCIFFCLSKQRQTVEIYNIGTNDQIDVISIATLVSKMMGKENINFVTRESTQNNGRGWIGDIKKMQLDITKLANLGWRPTKNSRQAITLAAQEILGEQL
jgi:UDP-glucose 4-epimerase